jgi:predicted nucleotide-binding protein (sugar kinase/HSP70/actin superfamily)
MARINMYLLLKEVSKMSKTVGIPKGLLYYDFYPMWKTFFEGVGAKVVVSQDTNKKILDEGVKNCVEDACLPVKTYVGHVINLKEKDVDYIFIPRIVSVERKKYLCSKFLGLPDFIKSLIGDLPPIIDIEINYYKNNDKFTQNEFIKIGRMFGKTKDQSLKAYFKATHQQKKFESLLKEGLTNLEALKVWEGKNLVKEESNYDLKIAVIAHPYDIMDEYISMGIIEKLKNMGAQVYTMEMLERDLILEGVSMLSKEMFWNYERDILGAGLYFLKQKNVDGVIMVSAFGCGPNSMTEELLERIYKREKEVPFMLITIDEHSGEAGIMTRLEAFTDLLRFNKKAVMV